MLPQSALDSREQILSVKKNVCSLWFIYQTQNSNASSIHVSTGFMLTVFEAITCKSSLQIYKNIHSPQGNLVLKLISDLRLKKEVDLSEYFVPQNAFYLQYCPVFFFHKHCLYSLYLEGISSNKFNLCKLFYGT